MSVRYFKPRNRSWTLKIAIGGAAMIMASPASVWAAKPSASVVWAQTSVDGRVVWLGASESGLGVAGNSNAAKEQWLTGTAHQAVLVSLGTPHNVRVIMTFRDQGHAMATFYAVAAHHAPLSYQMTRSGIINAPDRDRVAELSTVQGDSWYTNGAIDYHLLLRTYTDGILTGISHISGSHGIPRIQDTETVPRGKEYAMGPVFGVAERMANAPPFVVAAHTLRDFPFFGLGDETNISVWFTENGVPFTYDPLTNTLNQFSFVGFENGGIYRINSSSYPPQVSFESPFAFYNFDSKSRFAQLAVRDETFPKGDPYANVPNTIQQSAIRYSWTLPGGNDWKYSLQLAGSVRSPKTKIEGVTVDVPGPTAFPGWVMNRSWPFVNFVEATQGYPGSEGIYFYGGYMTDPVWMWLGGLSSQPPSYLGSPVLPKTDALVDSSGEAVPPGFRVQYSADYFKKAALYLGTIGDEVDLSGATGGVWNLGAGWVLHSRIVAGGSTINAWTLTHATRHHIETVEQLEWIDGDLIYWGPSGVEIASDHASPILKPLTIPENAASWATFAKEIQGIVPPSPKALATWIPHDSHVIWKSGTARIEAVVPTSKGMTLVVRSPIAEQVTTVGKLVSGLNVLSYQSASNTWRVRAGIVRMPAVSIRVPSAKLGMPLVVRVQVKNEGTVPWQGTVGLKGGGRVLGSESLSLLAHAKAQFTTLLTPDQLGPMTLEAGVGHRWSAVARVSVSPPNRFQLVRKAHALIFGVGGVAAGIILAILSGLLVFEIFRDGELHVNAEK